MLTEDSLPRSSKGFWWQPRLFIIVSEPPPPLPLVWRSQQHNVSETESVTEMLCSLE
jgi:hypothetical protein